MITISCTNIYLTKFYFYLSISKIYFPQSCADVKVEEISLSEGLYRCRFLRLLITRHARKKERKFINDKRYR